MANSIENTVESAPLAGAHIWIAPKGFGSYDTRTGLISEAASDFIGAVQTLYGSHETLAANNVAERVITTPMSRVVKRLVTTEGKKNVFGRVKMVTSEVNVRESRSIGGLAGVDDDRPAYVVGYDFLGGAPRLGKFYHDAYGRPGRLLTTSLVLPEEAATELTDQLKSEPRMARTMAECILRRRLFMTEAEVPMPSYDQLDELGMYVQFAESKAMSATNGLITTIDGAVVEQ